jgi:hypothetical protein
MEIVLNNTRYSTADLQTLLDYCFEFAAPEPGDTYPSKFQFYEYHTKNLEKSVSVCNYGNIIKSNYDLVRNTILYSRSPEIGVIMIASPESWMEPMECLAAVAQETQPCFPAMGLRMLCDTIKGSWMHKWGVEKPIPTSLHVDMLKQPYENTELSFILKRATLRKHIKTLDGDVVQFLNELSRLKHIYKEVARKKRILDNIKPKQIREIDAFTGGGDSDIDSKLELIKKSLNLGS